MTTIDNAIAQMRADGMPDFPPGHPMVGLGKITRYGPKKTAWYILNEFRTKGGTFVVVGAYGCWGKIESTKIEVDWKDISAEERNELLAQQRAAEARERDVRAERAHNAANRAKRDWDRAGPVPDDSPYLVRKRVDAEGVRAFTDGTLAVPMLAWDRERDAARVVGLQKIMPDGAKRFTKGMAKDGAFCRLGTVPQPGQTILVCEGLATGLSIRMATAKSRPVIVAFDAGNLLPVVAVLRERYVGSAIVICADDDWKTTRPGGEPWNPGTDYASRAAALYKAWVEVPVFPVAAARGDKWTDFNDLHVECGLEFVTRQINDAIAAAESSMRELSEPISTPGTARAEPSADNVVMGPWEEGAVPPLPPIEAYSKDEVGEQREKKARTKRKAPGPAANAPAWHHNVQYGRDGPKASVHNAHLYLTCDEAWDGVLGFDLFAEQVVKLKPPPWPDATTGEWKDLDDHRLLLWLSTRIGEPSNDALQKAVVLAAYERPFNPVKDYMRGLEWDKTPRLQTWLIDHCHVLRSKRAKSMDATQLEALRKYAELIGPRWLVGAVARVMQPGCKMDYMLVIESEGGFGKSSLFRVFARDWFTDAKIDFHDKDSKMLIQGKLIVEIAELAALSRSDDATTKQFITQQFDMYRPPYGRRVVTQPRRCVLGGTVNHDVYLKDESGNRRFWPIQAGDGVDLEKLEAEIDQIWAEAVYWYDAGERWWATLEEQPLFEAQQEERLQTNPWDTLIHHYVNGTGRWHERPSGKLMRCTGAELLEKALGVEPSKMTPKMAADVGRIILGLGWSKRRESAPPRERYYVRQEEEPAAEVPPSNAVNDSGGDFECPL